MMALSATAKSHSFLSNVKKADVVNPLSFGADSTGVKSSTQAINDCISFALNNHITTVYFSRGTYLLDQSGIDDNRPYAIKLSKVSNINFKADGKADIVFDINLLPTPLNAFVISQSNNISFSDMHFVAVGNERENRGLLYSGAGVYINNSRLVSVNNCSFKNSFYAVCAVKSSQVHMQGNIFINGNYNNKNCMPKSAFLLYSSDSSTVADNIIYGGLQDGDLSLFGSGTNDNVVSNNKLFGYAYNDPAKKIAYLAQGITIDQGPKRNVIKDNLVYGYFYGIDVKADTYDNIVEGNLVKFCKAGIAERRGEAVKVNYSLNNVIANNTIVMGGGWKNDYLFWGRFQSVGIFSENRYSFVCRHNNVLIDDSTYHLDKDLPWAGIAIYQSGQKNKLLYRQIEIANNNIRFEKSPLKSNAVFMANIPADIPLGSDTLSMPTGDENERYHIEN